MPDAQIQGLVLAAVNGGTVSDVAPVITSRATICVDTFDRLNAITAAGGVRAMLNDGTYYERKAGSWVLPMPRMRGGSTVINMGPGPRQGVQLASPDDIVRLFGHPWRVDTMTGSAMCASDDQCEVTSVDCSGGFNARFNVLAGGLHRITWTITEFL